MPVTSISTGLSLGIFFLLFNSLKEKALRLSYWRGKETNLENHQVRLYISKYMLLSSLHSSQNITWLTWIIHINLLNVVCILNDFHIKVKDLLYYNI